MWVHRVGSGATRRAQDPHFFDLDVHSALAPHVRFLVHTLKGGTGSLEWADEPEAPLFLNQEECTIQSAPPPYTLAISDEARATIPARFFRTSLERVLAPRHAYLQHVGLPHGAALLAHNATRLKELCRAKSNSDFCQLCVRWSIVSSNVYPMGKSVTFQERTHTVDKIQAFYTIFAQGLIPAQLAAQGVYQSSDWSVVDCTPEQMINLLIQHGTNTREAEKQQQVRE